MDEVGYGGHGAKWGYRYFNGTLETIDRQAQHVVLAPMLDSNGEEIISRHRIRYDYLVLAVGAVSNDFGTPGVQESCLFLETRQMADEFRQRLLNCCLRTSHLAETTGEHRNVDICIVGAGATGVELSAELLNAGSALRNYGLEVFDEETLRVNLVEAGPRILPALPEGLSQAAHEELVERGVRIWTSTRVSEVRKGVVQTAHGDRIEADLIVWAAGVKGAPLLDHLDGLETNNRSQLMVTPTLQTTRDEHIFALGDCCCFIDTEKQAPVPPRAQAAHQMADTVFHNLIGLIEGKPLQPFRYRDRGSLVSLSRFSTVGSLMGNLIGGRLAIEGRLARVAYVSLYQMHLLAIHGILRGLALIAIGRVNNVVRPKLKVH
jgi:NADH dehydrogenase